MDGRRNRPSAPDVRTADVVRVAFRQAESEAACHALGQQDHRCRAMSRAFPPWPLLLAPDHAWAVPVAGTTGPAGIAGPSARRVPPRCAGDGDAW